MFKKVGNSSFFPFAANDCFSEGFYAGSPALLLSPPVSQSLCSSTWLQLGIHPSPSRAKMIQCSSLFEGCFVSYC